MPEDEGGGGAPAELGGGICLFAIGGGPYGPGGGATGAPPIFTG